MAAQIFLRIDGITGTSVADKFTGQIECESVNFEASNSLSVVSSGAAVGKVAFAPLVFTKPVDTASPQIFMALSAGTYAATATLTLVQNDLAYATFNLKQVVFTDLQTSVAGGIALEAVKLAYAAIQYSISGQAPDGSLKPPVQGGWDLSVNKRI